MKRVSKKSTDAIVTRFKHTFIDFNKQVDDAPSHVFSQYIAWLYRQWDSGLISISEYRKLIAINILES